MAFHLDEASVIKALRSKNYNQLIRLIEHPIVYGVEKALKSFPPQARVHRDDCLQESRIEAYIKANRFVEGNGNIYSYYVCLAYRRSIKYLMVHGQAHVKGTRHKKNWNNRPYGFQSVYDLVQAETDDPFNVLEPNNHNHHKIDIDWERVFDVAFLTEAEKRLLRFLNGFDDGQSHSTHEAAACGLSKTSASANLMRGRGLKKISQYYQTS